MIKQSKMDTNILIVVDDPSLRNSIHKVISMEGYQPFATLSSEDYLSMDKKLTKIRVIFYLNRYVLESFC